MNTSTQYICTRGSGEEPRLKRDTRIKIEKSKEVHNNTRHEQSPKCNHIGL